MGSAAIKIPIYYYATNRDHSILSIVMLTTRAVLIKPLIRGGIIGLSFVSLS